MKAWLRVTQRECRRLRKSILAFLLIAALSAAAVQASPLRMDFSGTLLPGFLAVVNSSGELANWDNLAVSGTFIFDPATGAYDYTNPEGTYHFSNDNYPVFGRLWMLTRLNLPNGVVVSGNQSAQFQSIIQLYRNYSNPAGSNLLTLIVDDKYGTDPSHFLVSFEISDRLGTASTLFSDPNAGVSYAQPFNLTGESQYDWINIEGPGYYHYYGQFVLSSISITSIPPFSFAGFFSPVDNDPIVNFVKAGAAVPIKFSLGGNQGLNIFELGFPLSQPVACNNLATLDSVEETVSAGHSGLTYDAVLDQYTYVWKTQKSWAQTCRQLGLWLSDGTLHIADFQFYR